MDIDSGVPMPATTSNFAPANKKYAWDRFNVGDSTFIECDYGEYTRPGSPAFCAVQAARSYAGRNKPMKFAVRSVEGGIRIWRIA